MMIVCLLNAVRDRHFLYFTFIIFFLRNSLSQLSLGSRIYNIIIKLKGYCNNNSPFSEIAEIKILLRSPARRTSTRACQYSWK